MLVLHLLHWLFTWLTLEGQATVSHGLPAQDTGVETDGLVYPSASRYSKISLVVDGLLLIMMEAEWSFGT